MRIKGSIKLGLPDMVKLGVELRKLGFCGGDIGVKGKSEFYYDRKVWSELVSDKRSNTVSRLSSQIEFCLSVSWNLKLNSFVWSYGSEGERLLSVSQGLHSKLVALLG